MNAERLLAHFERISEAPDAIARLRRFILDLAVRGKLVEQDPEDESADDLLKEIQARFRRLRIAKMLVPLETKEIPFALPGRWRWTRLGVICEKTGSGSTPRGGKEAYSETGIPFLRSQNIYNDGLRLADVVFIDTKTHGRMAGTRVLPCDLLLNITGGSIGRCAKVPVDFEEANVSQHVAILRVGLPGVEDFLHVLVLSPYFQSFVDDSQTGAGRGGLPKNRMDAIPIPLPPLAEQHRIVAKVDELMALCDQLEAARQQRVQCRERLGAATLQRLNQPAADPASFRQDASFALQVLPSLTTTPAQIKQLRQTILNLAVRGKLVEQDPEDEPAEELLAGVAEEKVRKSSIRSRKADAIMSDDSADLKLFSLHKGWQWTTLEEYSLDVSTGPFGSMLHQADYIVNGIPVVNPSHMIGGRICPDLKVTISPGMADRLESYKLTAGDIVMARRGEVGRAALVTEKEEGWLCGTGSFIVRFIPESLRAYVLLFLSADLARSYLLGSAIGATMTNLNHGILKKMPIPLPPLAEQHRIVAKVDVLMALCDQLEQQLSQADQQRRRLLEALLAEALGGRLPIEQEESHAAIA
jgi:type I restriction enzyme, S subunit